MPKITFYPGYNGLVLLVLALVAVGLVVVFYRQAYGALRSRQWTTLLVLRLTAIGIVLVLLFRPVLSFEKESQQHKRIIFLLDNSASMSVADNAAGGTRWQQACDQFQAWWPALQSMYDLRLIVFSDSAQRLERPEALSKIKPIGDATSITRGLIAAKKTGGGAALRAVVLVSDGIQTAAGNPVGTARRLGIPVFAIGVGDPLHQRALNRDVRVTGIDCPDQIAVNNRCRIKGFVDATGLPGRVVQVQLLEDGRQVAQQQLTLDDVEGTQEVTLEYIPTTEGVHRYTVEVPKLAEEKIPQNNARSTSALVHEARISVLYLEGTLRPEYGAIVGRFLSKDPNIEFCALVQTRPNVFVQRTNMEGLQLTTIPDDPEILKRFHVFLIGDLDASYLSHGKMALLVERVRQGAGLIMIGGYHSLGPGGYGGSPLEKILPVRCGTPDIGQATEPFQPLLTAAGRQSPIFANIVRFFPTADAAAQAVGLPPLDGCVKVVGAKAGATVLLVHPTEKEKTGSRPMPVMAVQPFGKGRTAVFTADTTRNWHQALKTMERETPFLRFWGQTIRYLAHRTEAVETTSGIVATTDKAYYTPGEPIKIRVLVRGKEGAAATNAKVSANILGPGRRASRLELPAENGPAGHFAATFEPPRSGRYTISVAAEVDGQQMQANKLQVDVGRPNLEFDRLDLDEKTLVAIANESGGQYLHISLGDRLIQRLKRSYQRQLVQYEVPLAWPPLLWLAFVAVLTTEWLLRRRYQLR